MTKKKEEKTEKAETPASFLHEAQQGGRATGKVEMEDLDTVLQNVANVHDPQVLEYLQATKPEDWETTTLSIYCHDCRDIVPAGMGKTPRGKSRTVCGNCRSKKISSGREKALRRFYHIDEKKAEPQKEAETKPAKS